MSVCIKAIVGAALTTLVVVAGCDGTNSGTGSTAPSSFVDPVLVGRGEYLARSVAGCGECHTPRDASGNLDMSRWMQGADDRFDLAPGDSNLGSVPASNLTPDSTGIGLASDESLTHAIRDGVGLDGRVLTPLMPYYVFHNLTDEDVKAIVAYLRTLQPAINALRRQPLPLTFDTPAAPVPEDAIPHTSLPKTDPNFERAEHGRYLAGDVGFCMDCHTHWVIDRAQPLDLTGLFAGNRAFSSRDWGVLPPEHAVVYSTNITPHTSGIAHWTPQMAQRAIRLGVDDANETLCKPMPSGPFGSFGGMTDDDALDIGYYITTLPPIDSGDIPDCE